ncbi:hypothetical protein [Flavobacterium sp.]|uniref:hypothetical protein n=1 Tax=Flavobacterium sp. TaxID=239 RepID=UPI0026166C55|nr:hypothetical protein [Flavobacterium sp.]
MKTNFLKFSILLFAVVISSCSSDDSGSSGDTTTNLPLASGNYWTYDVENEDATGGITSGRDSLFVNGDILISGVTHKKMETLALPNGFYSSTLRNNGLRVDGNTVKISGTASYDLGLGTPINLAITDFIILKENATANEQLSTINGTLSQTISGYPLDFTYVLKSYNVTELASFTSPNGEVYEDVIKTKVVLNLKITTTQNLGGFPVTITVLAPQDVITSYQHYSKDIGMVYTDTNITYELQSIPGVTLPIPSSGSQSQEEFLDTYLAN